MGTIAWLVVAFVFVIDLQFPLGYSVNLLYVGALLLALWAPNRHLSLQLGAAATGLVAAAYVLSPGGGQSDIGLYNRLLTTLVIWVTAFGVTRQRRTLSELAESRELTGRYRHALDQAAIVATTNVQGDITYVNDKFCEISKYSRSELIGRNHRIVNSGLHSADFFRQMYATIGSGRVWRAEIRNRAKTGEYYWVDTTIVPFLDDAGRPYQYMAIRYDITERKLSEARLRNQEALAQLGKMAAVVAHEVRNPLAGIRGAMQMIARRLGIDSPERKVAGEVVERIDTLNDIVQDLLLFARPRAPVPVSLSVGSLVQETLAIFRQDPAFAHVTVETSGDPRAVVAADRDQLQQVLLNLLINAGQATEGCGAIVVASGRAGPWFEIQVIDRGPGVPVDAREHLFEPFFTTKHRGTGLGLATARRILEAHGGTVDLEWPAEGGTTATVRLPAA